MKYSVIVPVYGVEPYLESCAASILAQTEPDFEVILVDDCSPDNCPAICDALARRDPRIRVIHKPVNEGLGFARNTGLAAARGDYILFLDSDDHIAPTALAECGDALCGGVDILAFGADFCYENREGAVQWVRTVTPESFYADTAAAKAQMFTQLSRNKVFQYVCFKAYRREFLLSCGIQFEKTQLIEDFLFNIAVFPKANTIRSINKVFYFYRKPAHDTLASRYCADFFSLCKRRYDLEKQFLLSCGSECPEHWDLIWEDYLNHFVSTIIRCHSKASGLSISQQKALIRTMIRDPVTAEVTAQYTPKSMKYKAICRCIRTDHAGLLLRLAICADAAQHRLLPLYRKLLRTMRKEKSCNS